MSRLRDWIDNDANRPHREATVPLWMAIAIVTASLVGAGFGILAMVLVLK